MKKIPLHSLDVQTPQQTSTYLVDALEILLLGGVWSFVLVVLPVVQNLEANMVVATLPVVMKAQGIVSTLLATLVAFLRWQQTKGAALTFSGRELAALVSCAVLGVVLVLASIGVVGKGDFAQYVLALQAIVALAYFMARRVATGSV